MVKQTNEGEVNLKIRVNLYVNKTYEDGHIWRHFGLLASKVLLFSLTAMMLHRG